MSFHPTIVLLAMLSVMVACAFVSFESALKVLSINRRPSGANLAYVCFAFDYSLTCVAFAAFIYSPNREMAWLWHRIMTVPILLLPFLLLHFSLLATAGNGLIRSARLFALLYAFAILLMFQTFRGRLVADIYRTPWGWEHQWRTDSPWAIVGVGAFVSGFLVSSALFLARWLTLRNARERKQARLIFVSFLFGVLGCAVSAGGIFSSSPVFHTIVSNLAMVMLITPFVVGVRYSIYRYRLFSLAGKAETFELLGAIRNPVVLTDAEGNVLYRNDEARELAVSGGLSDSEDFLDALSNGGGGLLRKEIARIAAGRSAHGLLDCTLPTRDGGRAAYSLSLQSVRDEDGQFIGVLATAFDQPSVRDFQARYDITDRQIEIITLTVSGLSNKEIARKLGISERTVEHHHLNIYNKLGVGNKIELLNLARRCRVVTR